MWRLIFCLFLVPFEALIYYRADSKARVESVLRGSRQHTFSEIALKALGIPSHAGAAGSTPEKYIYPNEILVSKAGTYNQNLKLTFKIHYVTKNVLKFYVCVCWYLFELMNADSFQLYNKDSTQSIFTKELGKSVPVFGLDGIFFDRIGKFQN